MNSTLIASLQLNLTRILLAAFLVLLVPGVLGAQENSEVPSQVAALSGVELFEQRISEWRKQIVEIRKLRLEYALAESLEQSQLFRGKYEEALERGFEKLTEVKLAAAEAFREEPRRGTDYFSFLRNSLAIDLEQTENHKLAFEMASALAVKKIEEPDLARRVGMSMFINSKFAKAKELLEMAISRNATENYTGFERQLALIPKFKPLWERELEMRKKDAEADLPIAVIETTKGTFEVLLYEDNAPNTVANFITLAEQDYYEDMDFFMVSPFGYALGGSMTSGPGYLLPNEGKDRENRRDNFRGTLCTPARDERNVHLSPALFAVTFVPYFQACSDLYCNFGRVIKGMEVVDALNRSTNLEGKPVEGFKADKIKKITIRNKRDHSYDIKKVQY